MSEDRDLVPSGWINVGMAEGTVKQRAEAYQGSAAGCGTGTSKALIVIEISA